MIRGLFIFLGSIILLSSAQIKSSWVETEQIIERHNSWESLAADHLTFESVEHPGQLADIRLLKQKTSKVRTTNIHFWFIKESISDQFRFGPLNQLTPDRIHKSGPIKNAGALPLYLELNKILI